jgi:hypothetical protein
MAIFILWSFFLLLTIVAIEAGPIVRHNGTIQNSQLSPMLKQVVALFLAPLSCLAGFWFPKEERYKTKQQKIQRERAIVALGLTAGYLIVVFVSLCWPIYVVTYPGGLELPKGDSLTDRFADAMTLATMLSPLALAPLHFLTSSPPEQPAT